MHVISNLAALTIRHCFFTTVATDALLKIDLLSRRVYSKFSMPNIINLDTPLSFHLGMDVQWQGHLVI